MDGRGIGCGNDLDSFRRSPPVDCDHRAQRKTPPAGADGVLIDDCRADAEIQAAAVTRVTRLYDQTTPNMPNMIDDMTRVEGTGTAVGLLSWAISCCDNA